MTAPLIFLIVTVVVTIWFLDVSSAPWCLLLGCLIIHLDIKEPRSVSPCPAMSPIYREDLPLNFSVILVPPLTSIFLKEMGEKISPCQQKVMGLNHLVGLLALHKISIPLCHLPETLYSFLYCIPGKFRNLHFTQQRLLIFPHI